MVMDPGTAIGVASAAIAFIDFSIELIKGSCEIYRSLDGASSEIAHIDLVISDLQSASASLLLQQTPSNAGLVSQHEKALVELGVKCHGKCIQLLNITQALKVHDRSRWSSFAAAWKSRRKKDDLEQMHLELRDYRLSIVLRLNQMQIENDLQAHAKLDAILRDFRRLIKDENQTNFSICSRIKNQLYFSSIYRREGGISEPEEGTFDWITDQRGDYDAKNDAGIPARYVERQIFSRHYARARYLSWLGQNGDWDDGEAACSNPKILHISGKAGSGKSTLMRHLFSHDVTRRALREWAGARTLVLASFYFWVASGDDMQKSLDGLYRSILHEVLQQCPELGAYLFPKQWQEIQRSMDRLEDARDAADAVLFRGKAIREAFLKLVGPTASSSSLYCFCFFIDGLDEYREPAKHGLGDSKSLSPGFKDLTKQLLLWNKAAHVKLCTTARPHPEFLDPLHREQATVLHLESLNLCDIYQYCKHAFERDDDFEEMQSSYLDTVSEITDRADGVFLWALLTVRVMITSLTRGDSIKVQRQKLDAVPSELEDLYGMLLDRVDKTDRDRSNRLFLVTLNRPSILSDSGLGDVWVLWLDHLADPSFPEKLDDVQRGDRQLQITRVRRLLSDLTQGVLVTNDSAGVEFFHRTAFDYMKNRQASGQLSSPALDFENDDIYGRLLVADCIRYRISVADVLDLVSLLQHKSRRKTVHKLVELIKLRNQASNPIDEKAAVGLSVPPIFATFDATGRLDYQPVDEDVVNSTTSAIGLSMLACMFMVRYDVSFEFILWYKEFPPIDLFVFLLCSFSYGYTLSGLSDDDVAELISKRGLLDVVGAHEPPTSGWPCPPWMVFAWYACLECVRRWAYDRRLDSAGRTMMSVLKFAPPGAMSCKVVLNDKASTVTTVEAILMAAEAPPREDYPYAPPNFKELEFRTVLAEMPINSLQFEGHRLDENFKLVFACTDLRAPEGKFNWQW